MRAMVARGSASVLALRSYWIPGSWHMRMSYTDDLAVSLRWCLTSASEGPRCWVRLLRYAFPKPPESQKSEDRKHAPQPADPDETPRTSHDLLVKNDDHARSHDWALHQARRVGGSKRAREPHLWNTFGLGRCQRSCPGAVSLPSPLWSPSRLWRKPGSSGVRHAEPSDRMTDRPGTRADHHPGVP